MASNSWQWLAAASNSLPWPAITRHSQSWLAIAEFRALAPWIPKTWQAVIGFGRRMAGPGAGLGGSGLEGCEVC